MQVTPYIGLDGAGNGRLCMDGAAIEHLEILRDSTGSARGSLCHTLDTCASHSGRRMLRAWLCQPLTDVEAIRARQAAVRHLMDAPGLTDALDAVMRKWPDLERCGARAAVTYASLYESENMCKGASMTPGHRALV